MAVLDKRDIAALQQLGYELLMAAGLPLADVIVRDEEEEKLFRLLELEEGLDEVLDKVEELGWTPQLIAEYIAAQNAVRRFRCSVYTLRNELRLGGRVASLSGDESEEE